jgi:magnesium-transporting ATPase (P-type)
LRVDDIVLVRPGARVPADGTVVEGAADVDESMITGESKTVPKGTGARVIAGTVASGGTARRFPAPWSAEDSAACFVVKDGAGQKLAYLFRG